MNDNPYQAPSINTRTVDTDWLQKVARFQRVILLCILMQILSVIPRVALQNRISESIDLVLSLVTLTIVIVGAVFVFRLGILLFGTGRGIVAGIFSLMPCVGLIALLVVNQKATRVLRENHIRVGLLGANMSQL